MRIALFQIAYQIGMHPKDLANAVYESELTGEVPDHNPQSKDAWVDLLSLRNYIQWQYEKAGITEMSYLKAIRHIDLAIQKHKK